MRVRLDWKRDTKEETMQMDTVLVCQTHTNCVFMCVKERDSMCVCMHVCVCLCCASLCMCDESQNLSSDVAMSLFCLPICLCSDVMATQAGEERRGKGRGRLMSY